MGKNQPDMLLLTFRQHSLQIMHRRRIDRADTPHSQDQAVHLLIQRNRQNFVCRAEEQRPADLIDHRVFRNCPQAQAVGIVLVIHHLPAGNLRDIAHPLHKEDRRHQHADLDCGDKVKHNRQHKGHDKDNDVTLRRGLAQMHKLSPATHIIGNHKQDRCDGRHRDQGSVRHQDNQYQ